MGESQAAAWSARWLANPTEENFRRLFGIPVDLFDRIVDPTQQYLNGEHLLWTLYFLKHYPTDVAGASWAGVSVTTWNETTRQAVGALGAKLPEVFTAFHPVRSDADEGLA